MNSFFDLKKQRSTVFQRQSFSNQVHISLNFADRNHVAYTKYEKVFDNVGHSILLEDLFTKSIWGKNFNLLRFDIASRTRCFRVNANFFQELLVTGVVPKGSIFASLMFKIHIIYLINICNTRQPLLCAY